MILVSFTNGAKENLRNGNFHIWCLLRVRSWLNTRRCAEHKYRRKIKTRCISVHLPFKAEKVGLPFSHLTFVWHRFEIANKNQNKQMWLQTRDGKAFAKPAKPGKIAGEVGGYLQLGDIPCRGKAFDLRNPRATDFEKPTRCRLKRSACDFFRHILHRTLLQRFDQNHGG